MYPSRQQRRLRSNMRSIQLRWLQIQLGLCGLAAVAVLILCYEYSRLTELRSRAKLDRDRTVATAEKIETIRAEVPISSGKQATSDSILTEIRSGLEEANIPETRIGDIRVVGKTMIPKTSFAREDTSVSLKSIEFGELFAFVQSEESKSGTLCSGLEISAALIASDETLNDRWDVTLTLTKVMEATR